MNVQVVDESIVPREGYMHAIKHLVLQWYIPL